MAFPWSICRDLMTINDQPIMMIFMVYKLTILPVTKAAMAMV
jgi:hypothetical protein